jgi:hypothetical protein
MSSAPIPINRSLTKWEEWRGVIVFAVIFISSSIAIWHLRAIQPILPIVLLGLGLFLDCMSVIARIQTARTGKYSSGFYVIGFVFYLWAWVSYPHAVILEDSQNLLFLWLRKLPDILSLAALHLAVHMSFTRDSSESKQEAEQAASRNPLEVCSLFMVLSGRGRVLSVRG